MKLQQQSLENQKRKVETAVNEMRKLIEENEKSSGYEVVYHNILVHSIIKQAILYSLIYALR